MAFKDKIERVEDCRYCLDAGVNVPVSIFMSETLVNDSEENLWNEVSTIANFPGVTSMSVMPDSHASGNGIPVGIAVETENVIIPCAAGYDISCGVSAIKTNLTVSDVSDNTKVRAWINAVEARVATGAGKHRAEKQKRITPHVFANILERGALAVEHSKNVLDNLERTYLPVDMSKLIHIENAQRGEMQIGSEGGGNHFIELDIDQNGAVWMLIHTGSRGYGHGTAEYFFVKGAEFLGLPRKDKEKVYFYTDSELGKQYENNMNAAANFAIANRLAIFRAVEDAISEVFNGDCELYYEISHNLVQVENGKYVHRKGATRAFPPQHQSLNAKWRETGHPIIIPGSMGTASAILFAEKGAEKSLYSINHGCGRVMGRREAKRELGALQHDINDEMEKMGILVNTRDVPIDECLHVYKGIDEVLHTVETAGLATINYYLKPRAVIKGND